MTTEEPKITDTARLNSSQIAEVLSISQSSVNRYFRQARLKSVSKLSNIATGAEVKRFWRTFERYYNV